MRSDDVGFMRRALKLARRGLGWTSPNPAVGAVVVSDGEIVGEGYHHRAGRPHAEVLALRAAGERARGATLYATLEPCCHHGRTPPCTEAIIAAGIRRVVYGVSDPNPEVSGGGHERLAESGINVIGGILGNQCRQFNEAFNKYITKGRPFVILKAAVSLDGKIATATGESRWITAERARRWVHRLRSRVDAILVGVGTVLADDPELTARVRGGRDPLRIILDGLGQIPIEARCMEGDHCLVVGSSQFPTAKRRAIEARGGGFLELPADETGNVLLSKLLDELGRREITSVLVEGGGQVHAGFIRGGLADKLHLFLAPIVIGGRDAPGWVGDLGIQALAEAVKLGDLTVRRIGEDMLVTAYFRHGCDTRAGQEREEVGTCSQGS